MRAHRMNCRCVNKDVVTMRLNSFCCFGWSSNWHSEFHGSWLCLVHSVLLATGKIFFCRIQEEFYPFQCSHNSAVHDHMRCHSWVSHFDSIEITTRWYRIIPFWILPMTQISIKQRKCEQNSIFCWFCMALSFQWPINSGMRDLQHYLTRILCVHATQHKESLEMWRHEQWKAKRIRVKERRKNNKNGYV